ncbi:MAG: phosphatase PAP2 family protein [Deltaproteobacteria bacterium]
MWTTQLFVGRERPHSRRCDEPGFEGGDLGCDSDDENNRYRSFISGHPALVVAAAGVTCMHHSRMPIYGGGVGDNLACASMIGAAATTGVLRDVSGSHHASDVMFGTALGLVAGWIVPSALHYGFGEDEEEELALAPSDGAPAVRVAFVPFGPRGAIGAQVTGVVF